MGILAYGLCRRNMVSCSQRTGVRETAAREGDHELAGEYGNYHRNARLHFSVPVLLALAVGHGIRRLFIRGQEDARQVTTSLPETVWRPSAEKTELQGGWRVASGLPQRQPGRFEQSGVAINALHRKDPPLCPTAQKAMSLPQHRHRNRHGVIIDVTTQPGSERVCDPRLWPSMLPRGGLRTAQDGGHIPPWSIWLSSYS